MALGYEICIHRDGRWEVYSFFDADQENDAIYQAKDIKNNYQAVCVLAPESMQVVYFHSKKKEKQPKYLDIRSDIKLAKKSKPKKRVKPVQSKPEVKPEPKKEEPKEDPNFTKNDQVRAYIIAIMVGFFGLIAAIFLPEMLLSEASDGALKQIVFVVTLLVSVIFSIFSYQLSEQTTRVKRESTNFDHDEPWKRLGLSDDVLKMLEREKSPLLKTALNEAFKDDESAKQKDQKNESVKVAEPFNPIGTPAAESKPQKVDAVPPKEAQKTTEVKTSPPTSEAPLNNTQRDLKQDAPVHTSYVKKTNESSLHDELKEQIGEENQLGETSLESILKSAVDTIKQTSYNTETHSFKDEDILAATLYMCGCASLMVKHLNLPQKLVKENVPLALTRLDVDPALTESYIIQLAEYIHMPRHAIMFDRGVTDTKNRLTHEKGVFTYKDALQKWKTENDDSKQSFFAAILFTDIVDFSENTRTKGEQWMIDVLHGHNDITRKVLEKYRGQEIKHTGDGILAMFSNVHNAVEAATKIQRGFKVFNKTMPERAFEVRMGISAGDIVSMEGDVFGETVNLAARVMSKGHGGDIVTSQSIHGVCEGSKFKFNDLGKQTLKGYEDQHIYTVEWEEDPSMEDMISETSDS